ncbi:hypothetical protein K458DRAFT_461544 [Lentithecium fluviatile CBS 122367]|uniref:Uncharacterized protein n=1 Tax=Lentithecium fluviatile CBS 122367 TaxID=1168545 RepID=A0A6G1ILJ3_9PLEO|nr:hypothetical protein K458DRAFT_461544 [Lentithecium fluviatile CBS 122367]
MSDLNVIPISPPNRKSVYLRSIKYFKSYPRTRILTHGTRMPRLSRPQSSVLAPIIPTLAHPDPWFCNPYAGIAAPILRLPSRGTVLHVPRIVLQHPPIFSTQPLFASKTTTIDKTRQINRTYQTKSNPQTAVQKAVFSHRGRSQMTMSPVSFSPSSCSTSPTPPTLQNTCPTPSTHITQSDETKRKRRRSTLFKHPFRFPNPTTASQHLRRRTSSFSVDPTSRTTPQLQLEIQLHTPPTSPTSSNRNLSSQTLPKNPQTPFSLNKLSTPDEGMAFTLSWFFGKPCKKHSRRGRDLGSAPSSIRSATPPPSHSASSSQASFEMHPGTLVEFGDSRACDWEEENEEVDMEEEEEEEGEVDVESPFHIQHSWHLNMDYHTHLRAIQRAETQSPERRRSSAPIHPSTSLSPQRTRNAEPESKHEELEDPRSRLPNIDYKARKLAQRTRSQEHRERLHREALVTSLYSAQQSSTQSLQHSLFPQSEQRRTSTASSISIEAYVSLLRSNAHNEQEKEVGKDIVERFSVETEIFKNEGVEGWALGDGEVLDSSVR